MAGASVRDPKPLPSPRRRFDHMLSESAAVPWGSLHAHTRRSVKDAVDPEETMVEAAVRNGYGAFGNTDHGVVAGNFSHYRACRRAGIIPVPGCEMYIAFDKRVQRPITWHMGVLATTSKGWENLIGISNMAHRQFKYKPIIDLSDLQQLGSSGMLEGLWATTGCFFGILISPLRVKREDGAAVVAASNIVKCLEKAFDGRVLMELQHHGIDENGHNDDDLVDLLDALATRLSVRTVITTDSHYAYRRTEDSHKTLKRLSSWSEDPDSAVFPGDGYWLPKESFMRRRFDPEVWDRAMVGFDAIVADHDLKVPEVDNFTVKAPHLNLGGRHPGTVLAEITAQAAAELPPMYRARLTDELKVVIAAGFSEYMLIAKEVVDYCNEVGIRCAVRGSATSSLICMLLGITTIDPMKKRVGMRLRFDRFLSTDRSKPPDIDIDVEHSRRQDVLDYLASKYAIAHVATWRELTDSKDEEGKGSIWVKWHTYANKTGTELTDEISAQLRKLAALRTYDGIGIHAGGVLIAQSTSDLSRVPMQRVQNSKKLVCALDKDEIEALGYMKLDVLGLKTLTAIREMEEWTGVRMEQVPMSDPPTMTMIRSGRTDGVFQLNGYAQRRGMPRLKPMRFDDIVIALALFRPAVMNSGAMDEYLALRAGSRNRKPHHEIIEAHVAQTHGLILFQEQVLGILRDIGLDAEQVNVVLKAVKASNASIGNAAKKMQEVRLQVVPLCISAGFTDDDVEWLEGAMQAYAAYGFNLAHAVSYAYMAWRTAWYKKNHPLAYWTATLRAHQSDPDKDLELRRAMREDGLMLLKPHVNQSGWTYTMDIKRHAVRSGLVSVKGVGEKTAMQIADAAPFSSLEDLARRTGSAVSGRKAVLEGHSPQSCGGVILALHESGALKGMERK